MPETLYGPFHVVLADGDLRPLQRLRIAGSESVDGHYMVDFDVPLDMVVTGDAWTVEVAFLNRDDPPEWITAVFTRSTKLNADGELVVELQSGLDNSPTWGSAHFRPGILLVCTSLDEVINPAPGPNPYDFTVPERG